MKYSLINEKPEIFLEAVSKELKEKGQREMWKISPDILYRLNEYFINKIKINMKGMKKPSKIFWIKNRNRLDLMI